MEKSNPNQIPYSEKAEYYAPCEEDDGIPHTVFKFKQLIGDLRNLADFTCPDISYIVVWLEAAFAKPTTRHWNIFKAKLRCLSSAKRHRLFFGEKEQKKQEKTCSDADFENEKVDRRSVTGGIVLYDGNPIG